MPTADFHFEPPRDGWQALMKGLPSRFCPKGQILYLQGEEDSQFYYLKSGKVKIFLTSEEGAEKTLTLLEADSLFGEAAFLDGLPRMSSAKVVRDAEVIAVNRTALLERFRESPGLALQMLQFLAKTVRMLSSQVDSITFLPADQRIALQLLSLPRENGSVHCTHQELGDLAGASRVTVSRCLTRFAEKGWLKPQYRSIRLLSPEALERFAHS